MFPKWAYGYFQSKQRYMNSDDLLSVARKFREMKIPIGVIVQEWQYWGSDRGLWSWMNFHPLMRFLLAWRTETIRMQGNSGCPGKSALKHGFHWEPNLGTGRRSMNTRKFTIMRFYLGIDSRGRVGIHMSDATSVRHECNTEQNPDPKLGLEPRKYYHISATYNTTEGPAI